MVTINKLNYISAAKVFLVFGLIVGLIEFVLSLLIGASMPILGAGLAAGAVTGLFGIAIYLVVGVIEGLIFALLYNFVISRFVKLESS